MTHLLATIVKCFNCSGNHCHHLWRLKSRKVVNREKYLLPEKWTIEQVTQRGIYRYLGIKQVCKSDHTAVRERLMKVYAKHLNCIC